MTKPTKLIGVDFAKGKDYSIMQPSKLDEILALIHDNGQDGLALCGYETGRWPKPHTCGLPEARTQILALIEEVIGSDEDIGVESDLFYGARDSLRAEQRLRKDAL